MARTVFPFLAIGLAGTASANEPVLIGLDEAYSIKTNTSPQAIERGIRLAIAEINARGGVLGGRPLQLVTTDNQGVSARGRDNFIELASRPGMTAVFGGKFSPVTVEAVPEANRLRVPLVSVWGSADQITEGDPVPPFVFRLSLKDSWGVEALLQRARKAHKASRLCALLPNTAWGRSADRVLGARAQALGVSLASVRWYNWGDSNFAEHVAACRTAKGQALLMVANEREGAMVIAEIAKLPPAQRLPIVAHWGITGGALHTLVGDALAYHYLGPNCSRRRTAPPPRPCIRGLPENISWTPPVENSRGACFFSREFCGFYVFSWAFSEMGLWFLRLGSSRIEREAVPNGGQSRREPVTRRS